MRFFADGPSIDDRLLERCDQGKVVFLCGAGVSVDAGLPGFNGLIDRVLDIFDPPSCSRAWDGNLPPDQRFSALHYEFGREEINAEVAKLLQSNPSPSCGGLSHHETLMTLSLSADGHPQIVTTNFDRYFECTPQAGRLEPKIYEPPNLPDISSGSSINGIVYLHGRIAGPGAGDHNIVLSTADLGWAYLSEAWATRFMKPLIESSTVVMVGYAANDPPVQHLLEALNRNEQSDRSTLYAFAKGPPEDVKATWRSRGVTAIAYRDHPDLWPSLEAWADRVSDARNWRCRVARIAGAKKPQELHPHERGQVAHVIRTPHGARRFYNANPPVDWLRVFDPALRVPDSNNHDPEHPSQSTGYVLDDDPSAPVDAMDRCSLKDCLKWLPSEATPRRYRHLEKGTTVASQEAPQRIKYLAKWIAANVDKPLTLWWVARQDEPHPFLIHKIYRQLNKGIELCPTARSCWNLLLEFHSDRRNSREDPLWSEFSRRHLANEDAWSQNTLRVLETESAPRLKKDPSAEPWNSPPSSWEAASKHFSKRWDVEFLNWQWCDIEFPASFLQPVFRIMEGHLRRAASLLNSLESTDIVVPTCYPPNGFDADGDLRNPVRFFGFFVELFERMAENHPAELRAHITRWPTDDSYFFRLLKLFALNHRRSCDKEHLFSPNEAAAVVCQLDQSEFWDPRTFLELLKLVQGHWKGFDGPTKDGLKARFRGHPDRGRIEKIIVKWSHPMIDWQSEETNQYYLLNQQLAILDTLAECDEEMASITEPVRSCISSFSNPTRDHQEQSSEPAEMQTGVPGNSDVLPLSTHEHEKAPKRKKLTALLCQRPESTDRQFHSNLLCALQCASDETLRGLRDRLGCWIKDRFASTHNENPALAWEILDRMLVGVMASDGDKDDERADETSTDESSPGRQRMSIGDANDGALGKTTEGLLCALNPSQRPGNGKLPDDFRSRFERLLQASCHLDDNAAEILANKIHELHRLDPDWVMATIVPMFDFQNPLAEASWKGLLLSNGPPEHFGFPNEALRRQLKRWLLDLFPRIRQWGWDRCGDGDMPMRRAAKMITEMGIAHRNAVGGLTDKESRRCLREMDGPYREVAIDVIGSVSRRGGNEGLQKAISFIDDVWPRELALQTGSLAYAWLQMLSESGDGFPDLLKAVRRLLFSVEREIPSGNPFRSKQSEPDSIVRRHPERMLELLHIVVPDNPYMAPFTFSDTLDLIEEAEPSLQKDRRFSRLRDITEQW